MKCPVCGKDDQTCGGPMDRRRVPTIGVRPPNADEGEMGYYRLPGNNAVFSFTSYDAHRLGAVSVDMPADDEDKPAEDKPKRGRPRKKADE